MKKVRILQGNTMFVGKNFDCQTYNIIQRKNCLEMQFKSDGVFRTVNGRALISGFSGCYKFKEGFTQSKQIGLVTDIGTETFKIMGKKQKDINLLKIFPAAIPSWEKSIEKKYSFSLGDDSENQILEYFNVGGFEAFIAYNAEDAFLPDYKSLTEYFGRSFQYLGTSIRFRPGSCSLNEIAGKILKKKRKMYVAYTTSTEDVVITNEANEDQIFRKLELPQDKEAENINDITDDREQLILKTLQKAVDSVNRAKINEANKEEYFNTLVSAIENITQRLAVIEQLLRVKSNKKH